MAATTRSKTILVVIGFVVVLLLLILYASIGLSSYTCEVCIEFRGQSRCRTASGATREEAQRTATDNACAFLSSGMADSIQCAASPPRSVKCRP